MRPFKDEKGETWELAINVAAAKRVRAYLPDVNLLNPDPKLFDQLGNDLILACDVVYLVVKPQADQRGLTDVQFGERLGGDAIVPAVDALLEEWTDFFQRTERAAATIDAKKPSPGPPPARTPGTSPTGSPESSVSILARTP